MADLSITASDVAAVQVLEQITGPAAEAISAGQYCRIDAATGKLTKGKATEAAEARSGGIAIKGGAAGETITVVRKGIIDLGSALGDLDYDADVYLSDTDGGLCDADEGSVSKVVGTVYPMWGRTTAEKLLRVDL